MCRFGSRTGHPCPAIRKFEKDFAARPCPTAVANRPGWRQSAEGGGWEAARASAGGRAGRAWARPALGPCQYFGRGRPRRWEVASRGAADARAGDSCTEQAFGQAVKRQGPARGRKRPVRNGVRRARFRQKEELAARDGVRGAATGPVWTGRCGLTPRYVRNGYPRGVRIGGGVTY